MVHIIAFVAFEHFLKILAESQVEIIKENEDELLSDSTEALNLAQKARTNSRTNSRKIIRYIESETLPITGRSLDDEFDPKKFSCISCQKQFSTKHNMKRHRSLGRW